MNRIEKRDLLVQYIYGGFNQQIEEYKKHKITYDELISWAEGLTDCLLYMRFSDIYHDLDWSDLLDDLMDKVYKLKY